MLLKMPLFASWTANVRWASFLSAKAVKVPLKDGKKDMVKCVGLSFHLGKSGSRVHANFAQRLDKVCIEVSSKPSKRLWLRSSQPGDMGKSSHKS